MTAYVDSSALLKLYVDEFDTEVAREVLGAHRLATGRHTYVEVRRNLARLVEGDMLERARLRFSQDWEQLDVIDVGERVGEAAAAMAERTGLRTPDALHLGAAESVGGSQTFVTFDRRLADAARSLGWHVLPE